MPYSLPGFTSAPSGRSGGVLAALVCTLGAVLAATVLLSNRVPTPTPATAAPGQQLVASPRSGADADFHVNSIRAHLTTASEQLNKGQRIAVGLTSELGRNSLWSEQRKAEAAVVACDTARQAVEQALAELRLASSQKEE